jgi:acetyl-CoA carboxylase biotin carboxyl carrier protein
MPGTLREYVGFDEAELTELLALVRATDVVQLDVTLPSGRLRLRRSASPADQAAPPPESGPGRAAAQPFLAVTSPLVGVFRPAVKAGDPVAVGQLLGAIEALGMPTGVDAPRSGTVEELLAGDGAAVEYGQSLLVLRLDRPEQP